MATSVPTEEAPRAGLVHRLYHGETTYDFCRPWKRWFLFSGLLILLGLVSLFTRGLNLGIDFEGGTAWEVEAPGVSVGEARDALRDEGLADAEITTLSGDLLRIQADLPDTPEGERQRDDVTAALAELAGGNEVSVNDVGPSWGEDVTEKAIRALVFFFLAIAAYISLRFEWKMAAGALAAVVHDIFITVGVYSVSGFEVTPATVVAFLTILGYSLYDTIVVFDKVEENTRGLAATGRMTYTDTVNLSMNQVLMRSLNTSFVALLPILSVLVVGAYALGATTLREFGLALFIGLMTGAYSSIFIAAPILALLKEREPRYATIRQRIEARGASAAAPLTPAAAARAAGSGAPPAAARRTATGLLQPAAGGGVGGDVDDDVAVPGERAAPAAPRPAGNRPPPRGRKQKRRRR